MIMFVANIMSGFSTSGFLASALLAIVVAVLKAIFGLVLGSDKD